MDDPKKNHPYFLSTGTDLFFQAVTRQVSSARMSLTTVFGMGTGGTSP